MNAPWSAPLLVMEAPVLSPALWDFLLVAGVILGLAVIIFVIAAVTRRGRPSRRRSRRGPEILQNTSEHLREQEEKDTATGGEDERRQHRRKRRRRDHRPRNATLAETGGLPPEREPGQAPNAPL